MKLDEKILEEIRREEDSALEENEADIEDVVDDAMEFDTDSSDDLDSVELDDAIRGPLGDVLDETTGVEVVKAHDADESGTLDREEITKAVSDKNTHQAKLFGEEWSDEE
jgi:Ca2+-binding EF-hand superfamily protein